ncbi:FG-GAP repeat domain-containing protein [Cystobacter fuscus]
MGDVLTHADPRVLHVSKWVLSVGDAVATGDFDGDGLLDVFLSNALKSDGDRAALFRNVGDLRFERVKVPALERIAANYTTDGAASGGTFVDYDGDGDQDRPSPWPSGPRGSCATCCARRAAPPSRTSPRTRAWATTR